MDISKLVGNLTEDQIAKAKQCKTPEEFLMMVGEEGIDLTDEQMDALSGGVFCEHDWDGCTGECDRYRGL